MSLLFLVGCGATDGSAILTVSPASIELGDVTLSSSPTETTVVIGNDGEGDLHATLAANVAGVSLSESSVLVTPGSSLDVTVSFTPSMAATTGAVTGAVGIHEVGASAASTEVPFSANIVSAEVSAVPEEIVMGDVTVGNLVQAEVQLTTLEGSAYVTGLSVDDSSMSVSVTLPATVSAATPATAVVYFQASDEGAHEAHLTVTTSEGSYEVATVTATAVPG